MNYEAKTDVLAIGAHPDDIEICCGGTISKLCDEGKSVVIADATKGEMGTRGTPDLRLEEAQRAAEILGIKERINLVIEDGWIEVSRENIYVSVQLIRRFRPRIILIPPDYDKHPDHWNLYKLMREATFKSGLAKYKSEFEGLEQQPFRTRKVYCYQQSYEFKEGASFYVDISDYIDNKLESIKAYYSQVESPNYKSDEPQTVLSSPEFMDRIKARALYYGGLTGCMYAEAFKSVEPVGLISLSRLI